jgi:hypothetical protein
MAPLIALGGAITLTFVVKKTGDIKGVQKELDALRGGTIQLSEDSLKYAAALDALGKAGGNLTEEQKRKVEGYSQIAKQTIADIDGQVAQLEAVDTKGNEAQANQVKIQVDELKRQRELLADNLNDVGKGDQLEIRGKELEELGTSYEQLANKAENSIRSIADGAGGDPTVFNQSVKELIATTKQQVELGQISREEAAERLTAVKNNTKVEVGLQQSAVEAIGNIREGGLKLTTQQLEAEKSAIEAAALLGGQAQIDAAKDSAKVQQDILNARIKDNKDAIAAEKAAIEAGTGSDTRL